MGRLLYIGTPIFGYHNDIIGEFRSAGWEVDHFNDRPSENSLVKGVIKLRPQILEGRIRQHFQEVISSTASRDYDLVLIINGKTLQRQEVERMRELHPRATIVLYLWDSVRLYPHVVEFFDIVDRAYSFDTEDCATHPELGLLPLFYTRSFEAVGQQPVPVEATDLVSVCTAHANRYAVMSHLFPQLERLGVTIFSYQFLNPLQFAYNRARVPEFKGASRREFRFKPLPQDEYRDILSGSRGVYDMNHSAQTGLTLRTIETLGARRRLVTSNANVRLYRFFDPRNILVVDPQRPDAHAIADFVRGEQTPIEEGQYRLYSLSSWVQEIVSGRHHNDDALYLR